VVRNDGNPVARALLQRVFEVCDRTWRGIGSIPGSGWRLRDGYRAFDAELRFDVGLIHAVESSLCRSGEVLQGVIAPTDCGAFGRECTPRTPLGATMVSDEGTCAAYYTHRRMVVDAG
jgi:hydrogenase expression/formation protein HypD